jgi:hypothetical protein
MKPQLIEIKQGPFSPVEFRALKNKINTLFNEYTQNNDLSTILVVTQLKSGKQVQTWAEMCKNKIESITHVALYKVKQQIQVIK